MLRKTAAALAAVLALVAGAAAWAWWRVGRLQMTALTRDIHVLTGVGGNVGVLVTSTGVVVVDTMAFVRQGDAIRARIRQLTLQPIAAVLNTHYHLDHTHGNPAFPPGTRVISTARTLAHLRELDANFWRDAPARDLLPNDTFGDTRELTIGGKTVRAMHLGRAHTDGDLVVLFVEDRVLHAGDLIFNGHFPIIDLEAGGSAREWAATMTTVLGLDFDLVIPGHGPVTDRAGFAAYRDFIASLWSQTAAVVGRGGSLDDALREVNIDQYRLRRFWLTPHVGRAFVIGRAYEEASATAARGDPRQRPEAR